jgi:Asparagine synthase
MSTIFGGISFTEEEKLICKKMSLVAERWPFVKVKSGILDRGWFGEALPGYSESKWHVNESRELVYGELDSLSVLSERSVKLDSLAIQVTVRPEAGEIELWSGGGVTPLFYAFNGGNLVIGTDPTIVCAALDSSPELNPIGIMSLFALDYQTPTSTLFKQIKRLPPYHRLKGGAKGWGSAVSYIKPFMTSLSNAGETTVLQAAECLAQGLSETVGDGEGVCLPLSGGFDSRTLLAGIRFHGGLRSYTRGASRDAEVVTASKLAKIKGVPHQCFPFPDHYLERSFPRIVHLTGGCVSAEHGHAIHPLSQLMRQGVHTVLPGTNGEFGRAFWPHKYFLRIESPADFWNRFFALNFHFNEHSIRSIFYPPWDDALLSTIRDIQNEYVTDISISGNAPQIDLDWIYLLRRVPDFIIWGPYVWNSALQVVMPFLNCRYLEAVAGLPPAHRLGPSVHKLVMQSGNPKLLEIPRAPSGYMLEPKFGERWRALWRRTVSSLKGVSQGSPQKYASWLREEARFVEFILFSDHIADRGLFRIEEIRKLWNNHMRGGDQTSLLCKLLTVELACRANMDRMSVTWEEQ